MKRKKALLAANELINSPALYSTFLLWLLSELFEELPEVGNPDKPKMVFFFDEAHLLFDDAPKALVDKIEQVARLIRSKGVGIYFVTQNPMDIPDSVLGQLGNRIQHALRAYTPKEQKSIRAAASSFRENPNLDTEEVITDLGVGEAADKAKERARKKKSSSSSRSRTRTTKRRKKDSLFMRELKREGRLIARRAMRNAVRGILGSMMRR